MAKRGNRIQVILECTEHKESGQPGTSRYITKKNKKQINGKIVDVKEAVEDKVEAVKEIAKKVTRKKPGRKSK